MGKKFLPFSACSKPLFFPQSFFFCNEFHFISQLSCIANEKTLVLFNLADDTRSLQYSFKLEYGNIIQYSWFGDGYVLLSFQKVRPWLLTMSFHWHYLTIWSSRKIPNGSFLSSGRLDMGLVASRRTGQGAATPQNLPRSHHRHVRHAGRCPLWHVLGNVLKVFQTDLIRMRQTESAIGANAGLQKLAWTSDGSSRYAFPYRSPRIQIQNLISTFNPWIFFTIFLMWSMSGSLIAAVSANGQAHVFLAKIPDTGCAWRDKVAFMATLDTFHVVEMKNPSEVAGVIACNIEPNVVALGPDSFVAAVNNLALFYRSGDASGRRRVKMKVKKKKIEGKCNKVEVGY